MKQNTLNRFDYTFKGQDKNGDEFIVSISTPVEIEGNEPTGEEFE